MSLREYRKKRRFDVTSEPAGKDRSDAANEAILERANATGELFLSHTKLNGRYVLRLAIGSARTNEADVRRAWDVLQGA